MPCTKSDIANSAIRIFLHKVGVFYDEARGYVKYIPTKKQKDELLEYFNYECCYCGAEIDSKNLSQDHLIPINKANLGLHAWGNVVPCCQVCNNQKQQKYWNDFLQLKAKGKIYSKRFARIQQFIKDKNYQPDLNLNEFANNLYEDVGEVSMTLIGLRYKQAENEIK